MAFEHDDRNPYEFIWFWVLLNSFPQQYRPPETPPENLNFRLFYDFKGGPIYKTCFL